MIRRLSLLLDICECFPPCVCVCVSLWVCTCVYAFLFTSAACNSSPACCSKDRLRCFSLENKQNRDHFLQNRGTVKIIIKIIPLDFSFNSDSLEHTQLSLSLQDDFYLHLDILGVWFCFHVCLYMHLSHPFLWHSDCERFKILKKEGGNHSGRAGHPCHLLLLLSSFFCSTFDECLAPQSVWQSFMGPCRASDEDLKKTRMEENKRNTWRKRANTFAFFARYGPRLCLMMITWFVLTWHTHRSCVQYEHKTRNESRCWQREGMSFVSGLIVGDECDRVGAEGKQTSCLSCEIEEDQSVSES